MTLWVKSVTYNHSELMYNEEANPSHTETMSVSTTALHFNPIVYRHKDLQRESGTNLSRRQQG